METHISTTTAVRLHCMPWCIEPGLLGDGTGEDDGCVSASTTISTETNPEGFRLYLQSAVQDDEPDMNGVFLALDDDTSHRFSSEEARTLARALITHANALDAAHHG